jgi:hypothetical protein
MELPKAREELFNTYYLKEELTALCKEHHLPAHGSKQNLLENLGNFIDHRPIVKMKIASKVHSNDFVPALEKTIDIHYSNNETHRAFFKKVIGEHFKYNTAFMNWMEEHKGKATYKKAIKMYNQILLDKKRKKICYWKAV